MILRTETLDTVTLESMTQQARQYLQLQGKNGDGIIPNVQDMTPIIGRQSKMVDISKYVSTLSLEGQTSPASLPCHNILVARNLRFFGRHETLQQMSEYFSSHEALSGMSSLALYGLGGVGKSQIALEYAWKKQPELDVVLWVPAESQIAIIQALSSIATKTLKLPNADPTSHNQNAVLVMEWLKTTGTCTVLSAPLPDSKWLLIYDNVESPLVFESYWPVSNHGSIVITTRNLSLIAQPIGKSIEVHEFPRDTGARFLIDNLPGSNILEPSPDFVNAQRISEKLSGHALAISQMSALIHAKGISLEEFLIMYDKHPKKMHRERSSGWKYPGYELAVDTVWELSFNSLRGDTDAQHCLSIVSFLMPDSIPQELFEGSETSRTHPALKFCEDEYLRGEIFELLAELALIRILPDTNEISVHRLVQSEFLFHMAADNRQEAFDATILLLLDKFPDRGESLVDERHWKQAERYLSQVLAALGRYCDSQKEQEVLKPSLNLLNLICDTLWYLATNDSAGSRDFVLDVAYTAWDKWEFKTDAPLIHAYILARGSDQDLWNGEFQNGTRKALEALNIALEHLSTDNERVVQYSSDYGIALGSAGHYVRGANYIGQALDTFNNDPKRYGVAKGLLLNANMARNSYCSEQYQDAEERLTLILQQSRDLQSLYWQAIIHFAFISLGLRSKNLTLAEEHLVLANKAIENFGNGRNLQLGGMYNYFGGRVRLDQGRIPESIVFFEKAIAIDGIQVTPRGYRARHLWALSRAQSRLPENEATATKTRQEALRLAGNITLEAVGDNWDAFDLLIRIVER
ncbi:hypothetical protein ONS95_011670 [Cadophora gregata]|uniref:uncharacterized protein n=1 Tax=Cadophora gregata TaxID=51156 RepID=UPI0026DCF57A|nr:uncharacterized protein ONS95_011670 [Cadophora gregata]KAK0120265.1 hypothetical protein ONS95_011670 [Cadophora gregata]KAK0121299.1 hypothetical protein ONS96_011473 [Cadophora gregata f. sp. sojae]